MPTISSFIRLSLPPALGMLVCFGVLAADYEDPARLELASQMPDLEAKTELYEVAPDVQTDGFLNTYQVTTDTGEYQISSTALLKIRLREVVAIAQMREIDETQGSSDAIEDDVNEIKEGFSDLVEDPKGTLEGAASGVGKLFKLGGEAWNSRHTRKDENKLSNLGKTVVGYDKAWREYAGQFGVDPYSSNEALKSELDRLATAASQGSAFSMVAKALIPGGLGFAISATGMSQALNEVLITSSELELRIINREKLLAMGVDPLLTEQFLDDPTMSPSFKTYLVGSLETMEGTEGKSYFIQFAIDSESEDVAMFRASSAILYAYYHGSRRPITQLQRAGPIVTGIDADNQLVVAAPLDYLLWTEALETAITGIEEDTADSKVRSRHLLLTGSVSDLAARELAARGWTVHSKVTPDSDAS